MESLISSSNKENISKSVERVTTNKSVKGCYSILSPGTSIDKVVQFVVLVVQVVQYIRQMMK